MLMYNQSIKNEIHPVEMMKEPNWSNLHDKDFSIVNHVGKHFETMARMPEDITSISCMAMFHPN